MELDEWPIRSAKIECYIHFFTVAGTNSTDPSYRW